MNPRLHTIDGTISERSNDGFTEKYFFSNSLVPAVQQITEALEGQFVIEDWHSFGVNYYLTLMEWYPRLEQGGGSKAGPYDGRAGRLWTFRLLSSAACFRARSRHL